MAVSVEEAARKQPRITAPRIVGFSTDSDSSYYIFVKLEVLCSVRTFSKAIMLWFVAH